MFDIKKYRLGFDVGALILFLMIMCPNFIWFAVPAPNDILRGDSATMAIDGMAQIFQIIMVSSLCVIINDSCRKPMNRRMKLVIASFWAFYLFGWFFYYAGLTNEIVILDLCAAPCMAFVVFACVRKNIVALVSAGVFMVCHLIYGVVNFI